MSDSHWVDWIFLQGLPEYRVARLIACHLARMILPSFENAFPNDSRPREALDYAEKLADNLTLIVPEVSASIFECVDTCIRNAGGGFAETLGIEYISAALAALYSATESGNVGAVVSSFVENNGIFDVEDVVKPFLTPENDVLQPKFYTNDTISLAKTIYETNNFSLCPILADALMDAGYEDESVLERLRKPTRVMQAWWTQEEKFVVIPLLNKGIWLVDKLSGKRQ